MALNKKRPRGLAPTCLHKNKINLLINKLEFENAGVEENAGIS